MYEQVRRLAGAAVLAVLSSTVSEASAADTFFIDEVMSYYWSPCGGDDLGMVTQSLAPRLRYHGWTGNRWINSDAWSSDWTESCSSSYGYGDDVTYADANMWSIFAGHGNSGRFALSTQNQSCRVYLSDNQRLGAMSGANAGFATYFTCCTLNVDVMVSHTNRQWLTQQLGFHSIAGTDNDQAVEFYDQTWWRSNTLAFLDEFDIYGNSPIVISYDSDSEGDWLMTIHNSAKFRDDDYIWRRGGAWETCESEEPFFWYIYGLIDNGDEGCE